VNQPANLWDYQDEAGKPGPKAGQVKPGAIAGISGSLGGRPAGPGASIPSGLPIPTFLQNEELLKAAGGMTPKDFNTWDFGL
jgi:hypothetical protein